MRNVRTLLAAAVVLLCFASTNAFTQTSNATLGGTVSDASGALIPGVTITAANTQTGIVGTVLSNEAGAYQFASLQPGVYRLSAELPGFQTAAYTGVQLGGSQQVRLNFTLRVSSVATAVEVTVAADTLLATSSSSVGTVLPEYKVTQLPSLDRDVLQTLVLTTAGTQANASGVVGFFAGGRITAVNATRDGMTVTDNRYQNGAFSVTYTSPDMVEEVRVVVAPADAETSRGSGQVQMTTRSGTNQLRGSVFWTNRNSALGANGWFNNFNGVGRNYVNKNQYGGRIGGPLIRNKTFFHFLYEGQSYVEKSDFVGAVLTAEARQGIFRYFPGVQGGNALSSNPTVDRSGNPVSPRGATGPVSSFNVFTRDPLRTGFDRSGFIPTAISYMPLPNDFTTGDGLNTAGYRWARRSKGEDFSLGQGNDVNRQQYNLRIDHNFNNAAHKISGVTTWESVEVTGNAALWPGSFEGIGQRFPVVHTLSFVSTLSPNVVNEFRTGYSAAIQWSQVSYQVGAPAGESRRKSPRHMGPGTTPEAIEAFKFIPQSNGIPFKPVGGVVGNHIYGTSTNPHGRGIVSPMMQFSDTLSWTQGQHAFKGGFEWRQSATDGGHDQDAMPRVYLGEGGVPVTGIDGVRVPGLTGTDQANARNLLTSLNGSVASITQAFYLTHAINPEFKPYPGESNKYLNLRSNEWGIFFKDDWKIRPSLTLNLGVRYDFAGVPWEGRGILGRPVGGEKGMFGISGASFADLWQPGRLNGALTNVEFTGKKGPNPDKLLWNNDWNNIAPALGFSWSLPWGGQDKTVLRAGYGVSYTPGSNRNYQISQNQEGGMPGIDQKPNVVSTTYFTIADVVLPISPPGGLAPLAQVPLTGRNQDLNAYADNRVVAYVQNFTMELQREVVRNLTMEVRYVGSKGSKLYGAVAINRANIFENGILEAYNVTRAGGNAPLFDQMLRGLNLGSGVINGTTVTGSSSLRNSALFRAFIANGDAGQFAKLLDTTPTATGQAGGLLRANGLPENFIVANPQFLNVGLHGNPANSTYHSLNVAMTKRLSQGHSYQATYTWSRTLGEADDDRSSPYRNPRDRSIDKGLLGFHRTHDFRMNSTVELPFGPGRLLLGNARGLVARIVEQWQLGGILRLNSGQPLTITASTSSFTDVTNNTPNIAGDFRKSIGKVTRVANGARYFEGLLQITDPDRGNVTTLQGTQSSFSNRAITDAQGSLLLVNPLPGQIGTLGNRWIEGPGNIDLDVNLVKRVRIDETKDFEFRIDAVNVLNRPNFGSPTLDINSTNFGRITSASGNRSFVINARVNF